MNRLSRWASAAILAAAAGGVPAADGVHLWYDENGQAVYSQFPPDDDRATTRIEPPPPPPAESSEAARQRLESQLQQFEDNREDEALAAQKAAEEQERADAARQRCEAARHNLEGLDGPARRLFQLPDGQVVRLTEEEREQRRAEMRKIIEEDCR